ncbi:hypothetical protein VTN00DRAFT_7847 [Thermoascus crustaceus]|uniref:uncharacterized protein n=1 Tax=Thermoascus crustaceus TaxID=5088 RepID=UPI0037433531
MHGAGCDHRMGPTPEEKEHQKVGTELATIAVRDGRETPRGQASTAAAAASHEPPASKSAPAASSRADFRPARSPSRRSHIPPDAQSARGWKTPSHPLMVKTSPPDAALSTASQTLPLGLRSF